MTRKEVGTSRLGLHLSDASVAASGETSVYGRDLAVESFLQALWKHGQDGDYNFFYTPEILTGDSRAEGLLRGLCSGQSGKRALIQPASQLKTEFEQYRFSAWHDADAGLDSAARLRSRFSSRLYPITATVHILSYQGLLFGWVLKLLLQRIQPCDALVCISRSCRVAVKNLFEQVADRIRAEHGLKLSFPGQLPIIPYSIDLESFRPQSKPAARRQLGLPDAAFVIGWIGRLSPLDKADLLPSLQVFSRLIEANPSRNLVLMIAGSGPPRLHGILATHADQLGIRERVVFVSPLPPQRRSLAHAAADVFVSPVDNLQETLGTTPIEAMACGVPQVVSDWNGYRDIVQHDETGFLIPSYWAECDSAICLQSGVYDDYDLLDHFSLAQSVAVDLGAYQRALQALIENDDLREKMSRASRKSALDRFSGRTVIRAFEELWVHLGEIAANLPHERAPLPPYDEPAFFSAFRHYASSLIDDETQVRITELGRDTVEGRASLPFAYAGLSSLSSSALAGALARLDKSAGSLSFGVIAGELQRDMGGTIAPARQHLLWLMKYGLIEPCS